MNNDKTEDYINAMNMDVIDFFVNLGTGAKEMQKPMTLEEAVDILDPSIMSEMPEDEYAAYAREAKAKIIAVQYIRDKLKQGEEAQNNDQT